MHALSLSLSLSLSLMKQVGAPESILHNLSIVSSSLCQPIPLFLVSTTKRKTAVVVKIRSPDLW